VKTPLSSESILLISQLMSYLYDGVKVVTELAQAWVRVFDLRLVVLAIKLFPRSTVRFHGCFGDAL
jgi:hypothetical protein